MDQNATTVLLACLGYQSDAEKAERFASVSAEEWRAAAELAQKQNLASLFLHRARRAGASLPGEIAENLERAHRRNTFQVMRLYEELNKLLKLFREKSIPVIVLKGAYLAEAVYDQIGLRTMRDIDLLVKKTTCPALSRNYWRRNTCRKNPIAW